MMTSTTDEIPQDDGRRTRRSRHDAPIAVGLGVAGAFVALLLGLLTFGVQATVEPHHLPLAISTADAASATAMAPVLDRVAAQGGDAVAWRRVASRAEAIEWSKRFVQVDAPGRYRGRCECELRPIFEILSTGVLAFECALISLMFSFVHSRRVGLFAMITPLFGVGFLTQHDLARQAPIES